MFSFQFSVFPAGCRQGEFRRIRRQPAFATLRRVNKAQKAVDRGLSTVDSCYGPLIRHSGSGGGWSFTQKAVICFIPLTMKKLSFLLIMALGFTACKEKINYVLKVDLKQLSEEDIYTLKKVEEVIFDATERNSDSLMNQSRREFLKGADLLKNKNKPAMAVLHLKKSILTFPQAKSYYELGDALYQTGGTANLEEAVKAYEIAENLGFEPAYRLYFHKAKVYAAIKAIDPEESEYPILENLRLAFSNGYSDTAELRSLSPFRTVMHSDRYQYLVENYLGTRPGGTDKIFDVFRAQFGPAKAEFAIDTGEVGMRENNTNISFDFRKYIPEMQNTSFGREVSHEFFYVASVSDNPNYVALIYSSVDYWSMELAPVYTTLVTFDLNGNRISSLVFACSCTPSKMKTGKIKGNEIYLENFERTWLYPIDNVPFDENASVSIVSTGKARYRIEADGKIVAVDVPDNFGDTLKYAKSEGGENAF